MRIAGHGAGGTREIVIDSEDQELAGAFELLSSHGVRIHACDRETASFPELVAEVLGPRGGVR